MRMGVASDWNAARVDHARNIRVASSAATHGRPALADRALRRADHTTRTASATHQPVNKGGIMKYSACPSRRCRRLPGAAPAPPGAGRRRPGWHPLTFTGCSYVLGCPDSRTMGGQDTADGGLAHVVAPGHLHGRAPTCGHLAHDLRPLLLGQLRTTTGLAATDRRTAQVASRVHVAPTRLGAASNPEHVLSPDVRHGLANLRADGLVTAGAVAHCSNPSFAAVLGPAKDSSSTTTASFTTRSSYLA